MTARAIRWLRIHPLLTAVVWYTVVALAVTWRAWTGSGQLFLLDMPWPDHMQLHDFTHSVQPNGDVVFTASSGMPWMVLFAGLSLVLGTAVVQKLLLTGLVLLAGVGMWLLAGKLYNSLQRARPSAAYRLMAGTIYALNPYSIDRLWAGQWRVLAGYALAPLLVWAVVRVAQLPSGRRLAIAAFVYAVYPTISLHWWFIVSVCLVPWVAWVSWRALRAGSIRSVARPVIIAVATFALVNGWWLVGQLTAQTSYSLLQPTDAAYFPVTTTLPGGIVGSVLGLGGFWYHPFSFWGAMDWLWLAFIGALIGFGLVGVRVLHRNKQLPALYWGIVLAGVGATVVVIASGLAIAQPFVQAVMRTVPGAVGLRETTKLVGLLAGSYAVLAPLGMWFVVRRAPVLLRARVAPAAAILLLGLLMAPALQAAPLQPHVYPATWQQANRYLVAAKAKRVLVVPYAGYVHLPFAGGALVATPVQVQFDPVMLVGSSTGNPQYDAARGTSDNPAALLASQLVSGQATQQQIADADLDYIVLMKYIGQVIPSTVAGISTVYANQDWTVYYVQQ